jgi:Uma2 family endonuclease
MMATRTPPAAPGEYVTLDEFLSAYDGIAAEWVDGKVYPMAPVTNRHQNIVDFLGTLLRELVEETDAGIIRTSQLAMRIDNSLRVPDILFLATEHLDRLTETYVDGPADFAVEVVSPESRARDRGEKFYLYEQAGVREFWLVDPLRDVVELHRLGASGTYQPVLPDENGTLASMVLQGFWLRPEWLWRDRLPKVKDVLREWGVR